MRGACSKPHHRDRHRSLASRLARTYVARRATRAAGLWRLLADQRPHVHPRPKRRHIRAHPRDPMQAGCKPRPRLVRGSGLRAPTVRTAPLRVEQWLLPEHPPCRQLLPPRIGVQPIHHARHQQRRQRSRSMRRGSTLRQERCRKQPAHREWRLRLHRCCTVPNEACTSRAPACIASHRAYLSEF